MSTNKDHPKVSTWLVPSLISGVVSLAAITQGYLVATSAQRQSLDIELTKQRIEVSKLRIQIVESVNEYEFATADLLLNYGLRPIDELQSFETFSKAYMGLVSARAPEAPSEREPSVTGVDSEPIDENTREDPGLLTELFRGPERLVASNRLVSLYRQQPGDVVEALESALLPASDTNSYRVNLYVAFTVARLNHPECSDSMKKGLLSRIADLRKTSNYKDPTFRRRVEEALDVCN